MARWCAQQHAGWSPVVYKSVVARAFFAEFTAIVVHACTIVYTRFRGYSQQSHPAHPNASCPDISSGILRRRPHRRSTNSSIVAASLSAVWGRSSSARGHVQGCPQREG
ncbi:unnamed protein product [Prorocentrum cordatum]|uniref:Uncharacterized protein n=1 Tax=Prorocentrum cordatum TaxID=2364126 RepID=A0ABN9XM63_9DINO|nr:unnamed protein product [Polarella glacialis]